MTNQVTHTDALARLLEGNRRFVQNVRSVESLATHARRQDLAKGQSPFAVILSCSDSRVPSEIVFDCGLGDLFVVRVAGNVVAPSLLGSVEFAVSALGTQLVMVMGHESCGAVAATIDAVLGHKVAPSAGVQDIVDRIAPVVRTLDPITARDGLVQKGVVANVRASVNQIVRGSRIMEEGVRAGSLRVVGAVYSLTSGTIELLEG